MTDSKRRSAAVTHLGLMCILLRICVSIYRYQCWQVRTAIVFKAACNATALQRRFSDHYVRAPYLAASLVLPVERTAPGVDPEKQGAANSLDVTCWSLFVANL